MPPRALIFDLDDTLMDTCGQLVPEAHRQACLAMQAAGLAVPLDELLQTRLQLIRSQPRADIDQLLAAHYGCQTPAVARAGHQAYFNPVFERLQPFPGVPELLAGLSQEHSLYLVTSGYAETQARKVAALNIGHWFEDIGYIPVQAQQGKQQYFSELIQSRSYHPQDVVIIGDRINNEIVAGNRLGCPTIWIRQGECAHILPESPEETPRFTTDSVLNLPHILPHI